MEIKKAMVTEWEAMLLCHKNEMLQTEIMEHVSNPSSGGLRGGILRV